MSFQAGDIVGRLVLDVSGFSNQIAGQVQQRAQKLSEGFVNLGNSVYASSKKLGEMGRNLAFIGTAVVAPLTLAFKSAENYSNSVRHEMERLNSVVIEMRTSIAESLVPVMHRVSNILAELFARWNNLSQGMRDSILQTAFIVGSWTMIGGLAINLTAKLGLLLGQIFKITGALLAMAAAHPYVALTIAAIAGVAFAITKLGGLSNVLNGLEAMALKIAAGWTKVAQALWQTLDVFLKISDPFGLWSRSLQNLAQTMQSTLIVQLDGINAKLQAMSGGANGVMAGFVDDVTAKVDAVRGLFTGLGGTEFNIPNKIYQASKSFAEGWHDAVQDAIHNLTNFGAMAGNIVTQLTEGMQSAFSNFFQNILKGQIDSAKEFFVEWGNFCLKIISDVIAQLITAQIIGAIFGIFGGGRGLFANIAGKVSNSAAALNPTIGFAEGIESVPATGLYKLHTGEEVVPRYDAGNERTIELTIHNFITSEAVAMAMSGREGKGVILNVINEDSLRYGVTKREVVRR